MVFPNPVNCCGFRLSVSKFLSWSTKHPNILISSAISFAIEQRSKILTTLKPGVGLGMFFSLLVFSQVSGLQMDDAALEGAGGGLGAIGYAELAEDVVDVTFDGGFADA